MQMINGQVFIIFVTETKDGFESDDLYIKRFINYACKSLLENHELAVHFVHMDGIGNYNKKSILGDIRYLVNCNPYGPSYVVYVADRDRLKDNDRLGRIKEFILEHDYYLVINCKTIEDAFKQRIVKSKRHTALNYKQEPDEVYRQKRFNTNTDIVEVSTTGCTNLGLIIKEILENVSSWEPKKKNK